MFIHRNKGTFKSYPEFSTNSRRKMSSKYVAVHEHEKLNGPGDARPTAQQIVDDNDLKGNLVGKVALFPAVHLVSVSRQPERSKAPVSPCMSQYATSRKVNMHSQTSSNQESLSS